MFHEYFSNYYKNENQILNYYCLYCITRNINDLIFILNLNRSFKI